MSLVRPSASSRAAGIGLIAFALAAVVSIANGVRAQPAPEDRSERQERDAEGMERAAESMAAEDAQARSHFRVGHTLYGEGRFRDAASEFQKAYDLSGRSDLLFNMYLAYRDAGALEQAIDALRRYLDEAEEVEDREKLEARLRAMETTRERQRDPEQDAAPPEPEEPAGEVPEPEGQPGAPPPQPAAGGGGPGPLPWIVGGVGAAMLATAGATALIARSRIDDLDDNCPDKNCPADFPLDSKRSDARRMVRTTDILLFGGIAVLATGVVLYFLGDDEPAEDAAPSMARLGGGCTGRGCGVWLQGEL